MTPAELWDVLGGVGISWPPVVLNVLPGDGPAWLRVAIRVPDRDTGALRVFFASYGGWSGPTVRARLEAILVEIACHEVDENLYLDGRRAWDPHRPPIPDLRDWTFDPIEQVWTRDGEVLAAAAIQAGAAALPTRSEPLGGVTDARGARDQLQRLTGRWPDHVRFHVDDQHVAVSSVVRGDARVLCVPVSYPVNADLFELVRAALHELVGDLVRHELDRTWVRAGRAP